MFISDCLSDNRNLIDFSNQVEKIYTSTRLCVPKTLNICRDPERLWTSTFIQLDDDIKQVTFGPDNVIETNPKHVVNLKCFTGEPELENLMANGNQFTVSTLIDLAS